MVRHPLLGQRAVRVLDPPRSYRFNDLTSAFFFLSLCGDSFAEIINIPFKTDGDVTFVGFLVFIISINSCIFQFVNKKKIKKKDVLKYFLNYFKGATFVFL